VVRKELRFSLDDKCVVQVAVQIGLLRWNARVILNGDFVEEKSGFVDISEFGLKPKEIRFLMQGEKFRSVHILLRVLSNRFDGGYAAYGRYGDSPIVHWKPS